MKAFHAYGGFNWCSLLPMLKPSPKHIEIARDPILGLRGFLLKPASFPRAQTGSRRVLGMRGRRGRVRARSTSSSQCFRTTRRSVRWVDRRSQRGSPSVLPGRHRTRPRTFEFFLDFFLYLLPLLGSLGLSVLSAKPEPLHARWNTGSASPSVRGG